MGRPIRLHVQCFSVELDEIVCDLPLWDYQGLKDKKIAQWVVHKNIKDFHLQGFLLNFAMFIQKITIMILFSVISTVLKWEREQHFTTKLCILKAQKQNLIIQTLKIDTNMIHGHGKT